MTDYAYACRSAGIIPPAQVGGKTICPKCSDHRRKSSERCLRVLPAGGDMIEVRCYHCGWEDWL
jgi:RNase P subunit RPR2